MINSRKLVEEESFELSEYFEEIENVLLIEDCDSTSMLVEHYLNLKNIIVTTAKTGIEALEVQSEKDFLNNHYDLIITDISLPDFKGYEVSKLMRENGYQGLILAMSASSSLSVCKKIYESGCNYFIQKEDILNQLNMFFTLINTSSLLPYENYASSSFKNSEKKSQSFLFVKDREVKSFKELKSLFSLGRKASSMSCKMKN